MHVFVAWGLFFHTKPRDWLRETSPEWPFLCRVRHKNHSCPVSVHRKGIRPVKNRAVGCWHGYLSGAMCRFAYGPPSWCHCHSLSLASVKSRLVLPFWYWLTWVVPDKGPLNGCVYVRRKNHNSSDLIQRIIWTCMYVPWPCYCQTSRHAVLAPRLMWSLATSRTACLIRWRLSIESTTSHGSVSTGLSTPVTSQMAKSRYWLNG